MMTFKIYQLKSRSDARQFAFQKFDRVRDVFSINNYDCKYEGQYDDVNVTNDNVNQVLETIYINFNAHRPEDFSGWSLSVSDVILINDTDYYYVDRIGFKHIEL